MTGNLCKTIGPSLVVYLAGTTDAKQQAVQKTTLRNEDKAREEALV